MCARFLHVIKNKVKYWLTFNEINSVLHAPFLSGGIYTDKENYQSKIYIKQFTMN